jgi:hypothetical protein
MRQQGPDYRRKKLDESRLSLNKKTNAQNQQKYNYRELKDCKVRLVNIIKL